jgi:hypothetical protein
VQRPYGGSRNETVHLLALFFVVELESQLEYNLFTHVVAQNFNNCNSRMDRNILHDRTSSGHRHWVPHHRSSRSSRQGGSWPYHEIYWRTHRRMWSCQRCQALLTQPRSLTSRLLLRFWRLVSRSLTLLRSGVESQLTSRTI